MFGKGKKKKDNDAETKDQGDAGDAGEGGDAGAASAAQPQKSSKKLVMAVVAIVVLAGVGAGVYFSGILSGKKKEDVVVILGPDGKPIEKPLFYTLPDFLVNLNTQGKTAAFLKAQVIIEVAHQGDIPFIEANLPRVSDAFTTYLRELRPSDLSGSAGIQRLREELLLRVNKVVAPVKINDVLFKQIVVQ